MQQSALAILSVIHDMQWLANAISGEQQLARAIPGTQQLAANTITDSGNGWFPILLVGHSDLSTDQQLKDPSRLSWIDKGVREHPLRTTPVKARIPVISMSLGLQASRAQTIKNSQI